MRRLRLLFYVGLISAGAVAGRPRITGIPIPQTGSVTFTLAGLNPAGSTSRDDCLTIAAGDAAAYECGDLRVAHPLPAVRTMNRARAPILIYNSRHAKPIALFAGNLLVSGTTPSAVKRILTLRNKTPDTASVSWNTSCVSAVCRLVAARDGIAHADTTGWYPYTLEVDVTEPDLSIDRGSDTSSVILLNRSQSPFGAGWWIDGLEQLVKVDTTAITQLWIGGDGNTRLYVKTAVDSVYTVRDLVDRPDTLIRLPGTKWRRLLRNGAYVQFDSLGRHALTVNRQKDTTTFFYSTHLDSLYLPTPAGAKRKYAFTYTSGVLTAITAPSASGGTRTTSIGHGSTYQVTSITDPDGFVVHFGYDSTGLRIASRVNKLADTTLYAYDLAGGLTQSSVSMSRQGESALVTAFCAAETRSLVSCAGDGATAVPQLLANTVTRFDGPRTDSVDVTTFFVSRFGAPDTVVDAHANRTRVVRSTTFPALATNLFDASGHELRAYFNARGLADSTVDVAPFGGSNAVTSYKWDAKWAMADTITAPTGEVTYINIDATTGNRLWERVGANDSTKTRFAYNARNQVDTIASPSHSGTQRIRYDATLGNDSSITSPMGFHTDYVTDFVGQDTTVSTPTDAAQTTSLLTIERRTYDVMGRLVTDSTRGASFMVTTVLGVVDTVPARSLAVHDTLDAEGQLLVRWRYSMPLPSTNTTQITNFVYDAAHRVRRHAESNAGADSMWYDPAGNPIGQRSARAKTIAKTFDALNRLVRRIVPGDSVAAWSCACENNSFVNPPIPFPYYATIMPGGDSIPDVFFPVDTETFSYDAMGRVLFAGNGNARVRRAYFANGALQSERDSLRAYDPSDTLTNQWGQHVYVVNSTYDLSTRRTARTDSVAGALVGTQSYHYNPTLGLLDTTSDTPFGATAIKIGLRYDAAGRLISRATGSGGGTETRTYDDDDRLVARTNPTFTDRLSYDARGKLDSILSTSSTIPAPYALDSAEMAYDGFGGVVGASRYRGNSMTDSYALDALGNVLSHSVNRGSTDGRSSSTASFSGPRIGQRNADPLKGERAISGDGPLVTNLDSTFFLADASGNQSQTGTTAATWTGTTIVGTDTPDNFATATAGQAVTESFYDGAERLRVMQRSAWFLDHSANVRRRTTLSEYLYDALGRRILVRTRKDGGCGAGDPGANYDLDCIQAIERYVWDGSQRLLELRDWGDTSQTLAGKLNGNGAASYYYFFGQVRYTNAGAVDAPLMIAKQGVATFVPQANWAGVYEDGTVLSGSLGYTWPGLQQNFYMESDARFAPIYANMWIGDVIDGSGGADPAGTVYFRNRYYDPRAGQFTQQDPIGLAGGLNVYGYASGDPVNSRDPFGLCPEYAGGDGKSSGSGDCSRSQLDAWAAKHISVGQTDWKDVDATLRDAVIRGSIDLQADYERARARPRTRCRISFAS